MSVEETEETLTSKENRNIKLITIEDEIKVDRLFNELMGKNSETKKAFIKEYKVKGVDDISNEEG